MDEDVQLALYCCNELHYQGLSGVSDEWEWEPTLIAFRSRLEQAFESQLRQAPPDYWNVAAPDVRGALWDLSRGGDFRYPSGCSSMETVSTLGRLPSIVPAIS